eukprot:gene13750-13869_t
MAPLTMSAQLEKVAGESMMLVGLAFNLWSYLGLGWKWLANLYRLVLYAILLLPGFLQMVVYYFTSPRVYRSMVYGRKASSQGEGPAAGRFAGTDIALYIGPRQRLDMFTPKAVSRGQPLPVVIFVTGGAWTIGYKAWGALLARRLCDAGIIVTCLDYRNFPQGSALDMLEDVNTGISWVLRKIDRFGGDPERVWLVGQSAGGQLAMLALLNQATQAATGEAVLGGAPVWHPQALAGFVGVSGAYDLEGLAQHLHRRGLYKNLLDTIMSIDGESVPVASSLMLDDALRAAGAVSRVHLLPGKTHTDLLLEDALAGGRDVLTDNILACVTGREQVSNYPCMCPTFLVRLAGWVCPF